MKEPKLFLNRLLKENDIVVFACSAGPDSMYLLTLLEEIRQKKKIILICAHVNHRKRMESEEEYQFLKKYCFDHNIIFEGTVFQEYKKNNFHDEAHRMRQEFFESIIQKYHAHYFMTAHHGDDLIETILMKLNRGASFFAYHGFSKIEEKENYTIVRPLITETKEDIKQELEKQNIPYRVDASNEEDTYTRNRFRHHVLPFLKKENKNVHQKYLKFSEELCRINEFLVKSMANVLTECVKNDTLHIVEMRDLDSFQKRYVIENYLQKIYGDKKNLLTEKQINQILNILQQDGNKEISLPDKRIGIKSYQTFKIVKKNKTEPYYIKLNESVDIPEFGKIIASQNRTSKSNNIIRLNSKEIALPLYLRTRKIADKIESKHLCGHQKIKDIFINAKIPKEKREWWPILVDANDQILWVPSLRKSKFDKEINENYDIIYEYVFSEEKKYVTKK